MVRFTFDISNSNQQYVSISVDLKVDAETTLIQLPSWRPGRYELANFAKNVRGLKAYNELNELVSVSKLSKDSWEIDSSNSKSIRVQYSYYANEINAGSTFLDASQLYVNPVNCCVYTPDTSTEGVEVVLNIPAEWKVATSMINKDGVFNVDSFDELFDSPFIASGNLQHETYIIDETKFHIWFNGEVKPEWDRLIKDFKAFTEVQMKKFIEFPVKEYHFLNQILPYKAYHGVEHQKSTVISLGPSYDVFGSLYKELLGVSSHELYHTWNVKAIRPIEMFPYRWDQENYSRLGYICEGVTTYMGDLFLLKSGVFSDAQYLKEMDNQIQRHFDNLARNYTSVAESSFDTWLDGYVAGAPGRKVSIYTEGCLLSFVIDTKILEATGNKYGLDEVMKRLYFNYALKGKGVSEEDYQSTIESVSGQNFQEFFDQYVNGNRPYESILTAAFDYLGLEMVNKVSPSYSEGRLGFKTIPSKKGSKIAAMYPGGPAETGGLMIGDVVMSVNNYSCQEDLDQWLTYFDSDSKEIAVDRAGRIKTFVLPEVNRNFFLKYSVQQQKTPNSKQKAAYEAWKK